MIEFREPPRTGFELAWTLFGVRFRVLPSFFLLRPSSPTLSSAGLRNPVPGDRDRIDVACIFFAIVFTEFVQGLVYRSYGSAQTVVIQEFGGGIYPEHEPPTALQRIVAALSNPASSFLLFAIVYYSNQEYQLAQAPTCTPGSLTSSCGSSPCSGGSSACCRSSRTRAAG